uniref:Toxoplasma gondii family B protein n=1 Tax=Toxoplasma gondii COUG TaxID=1074873 RepID=A0A2G8Y6J8_TOXGO|nr:Toxoplasma gondii family B protein [Toxoplasma gondii COUG]
MTANLSSAATVALCIFLSCNLHNYCFGSWTLAAEQLDTAPGIRGSDARHAPSAVPSSAIPAEAEQQQAPVAVRLKKLKRTSLRKNGTALSRRTKTVTAAKVVLSLTAVLGLLAASVKLYQCRQKLPANTSKQAAGSTGRRLAEGGSDDKTCVSVALSSPWYR